MPTILLVWQPFFAEGTIHLKRLNSVLTLLGIVLLLPGLRADEPHSHAPLVVPSRPVIARVPVKVIRPVDVVVNSLDETLIADETGQCLLRVDVNGTASVLADQLPGVSRIADSPQLGTYLLQKNARSGRVYLFTDGGQQMDVAYLPFQPTALAVDTEGKLYTADNSKRRLVLIDDEGKQSVYARLPEAVRDLAIDAIGSVVVLFESGRVGTVTSENELSESGFVSPNATRLAQHPTGFVVALAPDSLGKSYLLKATSDRQQIDRFAAVPRGTTAFAFDALGNLTLANADLRAITQVNSHFEVQCPHCGKPMSMILSADAPAVKQPKRRSF